MNTTITDNEKGDPALCLNEECMFQIFSFVGGKLAKTDPSSHLSYTTSQDAPKEEEAVEIVEEEVDENEQEGKDNKTSSTTEEEQEPLINAFEAARYYYALAHVSQSWKVLMDKFIVRLATGVDVDFTMENAEQKTKCILWVTRHKLKIRSINCFGIKPPMPGARDYPLLVDLLTECDTQDVTTIYFRLDCSSLGSRYRATPPSLNDDVQRTMQDMFAGHCPNVRDLRVWLDLSSFSRDNDHAKVISPALFSSSKLTFLNLGFHADLPVSIMDTHFFQKFIQNLPTLKYLLLTTSPTLRSLGDTTVFHFQSNSLEQLLVEDFTKHVELSIDCPNLNVFRCKGGIFGGFQHRPNDARQIMVQQKVSRWKNVPESCLALIQHVCNPEGHPIGLQFHDLVNDPTVTFLPTRNPHA